MIVAALQLAGFYLLAASMLSHRAVLLGPAHRKLRASSAAMTGWLLLAVALIVALATGGGIGAVTWFGLLPLTSGAVLLGRTFAPRLLGRAVAAILLLGVVTLAV